MRKSGVLYVVPTLVVLTLSPTPACAQHYTQANLVSNTSAAPVPDPNLRNAWGLVHSPTSPWWISNNASGTSTLVNASTTPVTIPGLVVAIPPPKGQTGTGTPTGMVYNGSTSDFLLPGGKAAAFIWVTEDGTVAAWNSGTQAVLMADNSQKPTAADGAVYKGATIVIVDGHRYLLATNFRSGHVDAFDSSFTQVSLDKHASEDNRDSDDDRDSNKHAFEDERIPKGFAPFGIQSVGANVYVTYAKQDAVRHDDVPGAGFGYAVVYSSRGDVVARLEHGPWLNSPWGIAAAPADFGVFSHALLIGNFGDGSIAAFNAVTGRFLGNVLNPDGSVLKIDGLWGLSFGNGGASGPGNTLFFTAGPNGENDGLFGTLKPIPAELNGSAGS